MISLLITHEGVGPGRGVPLPGEGSGAKPRKLIDAFTDHSIRVLYSILRVKMISLLIILMCQQHFTSISIP